MNNFQKHNTCNGIASLTTTILVGIFPLTKKKFTQLSLNYN
jgi:hypothetical protein